MIGPPFFSIFCAARNAEPFIVQSLRALKGQSFDSWELIFVDDASEDHTSWLAEREMLEKGYKVACVQRDRRYGKVQNFLDVFSGFSGEVIVEYDGDDWFASPQALSRLRRVYDDPEVGATTGRASCLSTGEEPKILDYPPCHRYATTNICPVSPRTTRRALFDRLLADHRDLFIDPATGEGWTLYGDVVLSAPAMLLAPKIEPIRDQVLYTINDDHPNRDSRLYAADESRAITSTFAACIDLEFKLQGPIDWERHAA